VLRAIQMAAQLVSTRWAVQRALQMQQQERKTRRLQLSTAVTEDLLVAGQETAQQTDTDNCDSDGIDLPDPPDGQVMAAIEQVCGFPINPRRMCYINIFDIPTAARLLIPFQSKSMYACMHDATSYYAFIILLLHRPAP
jgi:hypothetical protein